MTIDTSILECNVFEMAEAIFDASPESIAFQDFGPYQISGEPIGRGGMGEVFLAFDYAAGRRVAIKFLRGIYSEPELRARFDHEIRMLAQLEHPFVARLYDAGIHPNGAPYFVMEYVEGESLDQFCVEQNCSLEQRLRLFRAICEAVQYAHSRLVVHRDLKPSNILVKSDGTPKLLDFGIAKQLDDAAQAVTQTRTEARFTQAYAAPEQLRREQIGVFTDVYALGVILYELVAGRPPYDLRDCTPGQAETIITSDTEAPKPSSSGVRVIGSRSIWNDLDVLCLKALKKDVSRRYQSVSELIQDTDHLLRQEPLRARPDSLSYRARKFISRNRVILVAAATLLILVAALVSFYTWRLANARNAALAETARTRTVEQFLQNLFQGGDKEAGPASDLKVVTLLDHGVKQLPSLNRDPALQADLYQTLGTIYRELGSFDRADQLLQSALSSRKSRPNDSLEVADTMIALATVRIDQAKLREAEALSRDAFALSSAREEAHPASERARSTLARVFEEYGQYRQALNLLSADPDLTDQHAVLSADRAETLNVLADAYFYLGQYPAARLAYTRAADVSRSVFGSEHPNVAENDIGLGHVSLQLGHYQDAEHYYRQALAIEREWYGNEHPLTARAEGYVAQSLGWQRRFNEDRELVKHALMVQEKNFGPNHPQVALVLGNLGFVDYELNHLADAENDWERMLAIYRSVYGEKHQYTAVALSNLGSLFTLKKQYARAEALFREALAIYAQVLPAGALNTAIARVKLGRVLLAEKRYQEAESYSLPGYEAIKKQASPSIEYVRSSASDLIKIYSGLHRPDRVAYFQAEWRAAQKKP